MELEIYIYLNLYDENVTRKDDCYVPPIKKDKNF